MASQEHLWTTHKENTPHKCLDPCAIYDFFPIKSGNSKHRSRSKSAGSVHLRTNVRNPRNVNGWISPSSPSLRNPSPSLASASRPNSARSGYSTFFTKGSARELAKSSSSPSALYLASRRQYKTSSLFNKMPKTTSSTTSLYLVGEKTAVRCKSAPPRPAGARQVGASKQRTGSALLSSRSASQRAWQMRTNSAKKHHNLLSPEEIRFRCKERCKSAPLPYNFSDINVVTAIPENGTDEERLQAMTQPLSCIPQIVQNVLNHNGLRHCCSAYQSRPKTAPESQKQFWPVARPAVYRRGFVPKYVHFVKPVSLNSRSSSDPRIQTSDYEEFFDEIEDGGMYGNVLSDLSLMEADQDELVQTELYEDWLELPDSPSEPVGDWESQGEDELDGLDELARRTELQEDSVDKANGECDPNIGSNGKDNKREDAAGFAGGDSVPGLNLDELDSTFQELEMEVIITRKTDGDKEHEIMEEPETETDPKSGTRQVPDVDPCFPTDKAQAADSVPEGKADESLQGSTDQSEGLRDLVPGSETGAELVFAPKPQTSERLSDNEPSNDVGPNNEVLNKGTKELPAVALAPRFEGPQVKFVDSIVVTSFTPPKPREEAPKSILKSAKEETKPKPRPEPKIIMKAAAEPAKLTLPENRPRPSVERRDADIKEQRKPNPKLIFLESKLAQKKEESENATIQPRKESDENLPERLADPEFVPRPAAYRLYEPQTLLSHHLEYAKDRRLPKRSVSALPSGPVSGSMPVPGVRLSSESALVMNSVLEEEKRKREGLKPWLQGRLALSKQTSRFELPMDVKILESMTAMDYLSRFCIISTRRKALYKTAFLKVDKDRDGRISYKEMEKGLRDIHVDFISKEQINKIAEMVEANSSTQLTLKQFSAVAALSERLLYSDFATDDTNNGSHSKEIIEEADFCGLKWKLDGFKVDPKLRKILQSL